MRACVRVGQMREKFEVGDGRGVDYRGHAKSSQVGVGRQVKGSKSQEAVSSPKSPRSQNCTVSAGAGTAWHAARCKKAMLQFPPKSPSCNGSQ